MKMCAKAIWTATYEMHLLLRSLVDWFVFRGPVRQPAYYTLDIWNIVVNLYQQKSHSCSCNSSMDLFANDNITGKNIGKVNINSLVLIGCNNEWYLGCNFFYNDRLLSIHCQNGHNRPPSDQQLFAMGRKCWLMALASTLIKN